MLLTSVNCADNLDGLASREKARGPWKTVVVSGIFRQLTRGTLGPVVGQGAAHLVGRYVLR